MHMQSARFRFCGIKSQSATTLLEVMVAVGLIGIIVAGSAQFFGATFKAQRIARIKAVYQFVAQDLANKLNTPSNLYLSLLLANNASAYVRCLLNAEITNPMDELNSVCLDLNLTTFDPTNPLPNNIFALAYQTGIANLAIMTGDSGGNVQLYDTTGLPCRGPDVRTDQGQTILGPKPLNSQLYPCVFQAAAYFYVSCGLSDPDCLSGPQVVNVGYQVSQVAPIEGQSQPFQPIPQSIHFTPIQMKDILGTFYNSTCNPGALVSGYNPNGTAICSCAIPYTQALNASIPLVNNRGPICQMLTAAQLTCPQGLLFRGVLPNGMANCVNPADAYNCISTGPGANDINPSGSINEIQKCPAGYFVQTDYRRDCYFYCTIPKANSTSCGSNEFNDSRSPGGYVWISNDIQKPQYTQSSNSSGSDVAAWYKQGLVCAERQLTCCQPI